MQNSLCHFLLLFMKKPISSYQQNLLIDFLKGLLGQSIKVEVADKEMIVYFNNDEEIDFNEISNVINNELYINLVLFNGSVDRSNVYEYITFLKFKYYSLELGNVSYLDERILISLSAMVDNDQLKKNVFKKYYNDYTMLNIIKVFIECNFNTSQAATELFLHRNTLIGKIDRFIKETGYDVKSFNDAYIIYHLLK